MSQATYVIERPEKWQNLKTGEDYSVSFAVIDNAILLVQPAGDIATADMANYLELRRTFIDTFLGQQSKFVEIRDFNSAWGRPSKKSRYIQKNQFFLDKDRQIGQIYIQLPDGLKFIFKLGLKIYRSPFPFLFLDDLDESVSESHKLLQQSGAEPFTENEEWSYRSQNWEQQIKILPNNIMFIKNSGFLEEKDLKPTIELQKKIFQNNSADFSNYYRISDISEVSGGHWRARRLYSQQLWHYLDENGFAPLAIIFIGGSSAFKMSVKAFQYFIGRKMYFVDNETEAFALIKKMKNDEVIETLDNRDPDISALTSAIARLSWDELDGNQFPSDPNHKFREVYEALNLLRYDISTILSERDRAQKELLDSAHKAGMAEISTGVLHNIGNILNTTSTSFYQIEQSTLNCPTEQVNKLSELIQEHRDDMPTFLTEDERGKKIPEFVVAMAKTFEVLKNEQLKNLKRAEKSIAMVKDAISAQQDYSRGSYFEEYLDLGQEVKKVLALMESSLKKYAVNVNYHSDTGVKTVCQKSKLAHIITNLVKNAYEAMNEKEGPSELTINVTRNEAGRPLVLIKDNGPGIDETIMAKIFTYGFTTKKSGYGFGLHHSANAMTEMGGQLHAASDENGTTFSVCFECDQ